MNSGEKSSNNLSNDTQPNHHASGFNGLEFQLLQNWLNCWKFEGSKTGDFYLTLDDYCQSLRFYKLWSGHSDELILRCISVSLTGRALTWWSNIFDKFSSLDEFEEQLRLRFSIEHTHERFINDRRQYKNEDLLDYIDQKLYHMQRPSCTYSCLPDEKKISIIIDSTIARYRIPILRSTQGVKSVKEFTEIAAKVYHSLNESN